MSISLFIGQLSILATAAIRHSLSSFSILHSSNMCSAVLIVVSAWAVWCFDDFEPVEVGLYVSVARDHGCEVLC